MDVLCRVTDTYRYTHEGHRNLDTGRIVETIHRRMVELNMSSTDLGRKAGLSMKTVYNVLNEEVEPRPVTLGKLSQALGWTPDVLMGVGEGGGVPESGPPSDPMSERFDRLEEKISRLADAVERLAAHLREG